ncbi:DUF1772 domain-containing protein [Amycolatopsis taiwanensis]|uniref:DUF1772 domain-containing protein n=1 Tax=Amycolatopsis taiwanensis TaxID=342230 RepID=A0A9W6R5H7_9PSEU|nr:DUF1772 domain-containing protein [Amycolatopsis taiwanensis]GLY68715.1 hypothetical protein Atai01_53340 [Amycolatopsis taiwanensis]
MAREIRRRIIGTTAVAATAAFACGALLTQTVIVPSWQAMDPAAFLRHFAVYGPITGATVFPFALAAVPLLAGMTYSTVRNRQPGRIFWALATAGMVGTLALLPIYFVPANLAMLDPAFPVQSVHAELIAWYRWNWLRTGLGLASAALATIAAVRAGRSAGASSRPSAPGRTPFQYREHRTPHREGHQQEL